MGVMEQSKRNRMLLGQDNNALTWLIIINAVMFVLINFIKIIYFLSDISGEVFQQQIMNWFTLPADLHMLATRPWVVLTHMFTQDSVWRLIGTLLWLWGFGYILQDLTGNRKIIPIYLYGGITGAVFFLLSMHAFPVLYQNIDQSPALVGAGASVMAIAVATTTLAPDYRIFPMINGGIPLWVLTLVFIAIDYATIASVNAGFAMAHLAGGAMGFVFVRQLRKGRDWGQWMTNLLNWLDDLFNPEKKHVPQTSKQTHFYKTTRQPFQKKSNITQQRIDEILDKINQEGYHFLTDEEKDFLKRASEEQDI